MKTLPLMVMLAAVLGLMVPGCSSGGPAVSGGSDLLGTQVIHVGETMTITVPYQAKPGEPASNWRVESFDSLRLEPWGVPGVERDSNGKMMLVIRFRGGMPGKTDIVLGEYRGPYPGERVGQRTYKVSVVN